MTKIYFAGKISKNDWRNTLTKKSLVTAGPLDDVETVCKHEYVGPFFMSCDHGCFHGHSSHGLTQRGYGGCCASNDGFSGSTGFTRDVIANNCLRWIDYADIVFAWINTKDCFGTLAEIGYAHAKNKPIWLVYSDVLFNIKLEWPTNIIPDRHDMWFIDQMAEKVAISNNPLEVYKKWSVELV